MSDSRKTGRSIRFERLSENLISFRLSNLFITDNRFLFIAPQQDFCRICFQRRYASQIDGAGVVQVSEPVLHLAESLDARFNESRLWRWFLVEGRKAGRPFDLVPYQDCPACGKEEFHDRAEAAVHYERLMNQESVPGLEALRNQVFSFGFARGLLSDNQIGSASRSLDRIQGELRQIMGDAHHARIIYRIITADGRQINDTSTGMVPDKTLAELKSIMEYLERYAFSLRTCSLKTTEHDDQVIDEFLSLYRDSVTEDERRRIGSLACWGINLCTSEIRAIPIPLIFSEGRLRSIQSTTSGFAAHVDFRMSLCGSILELVERDAFVRFWYDPRRAYNFEPDASVQSALDDIAAALRKVLGNDCLACSCFIVESPTKLPVVMVTISSRDFSMPPSLCFGYGTGFDIQEALSGALRELRVNAGNLVKAVSCFDGYLKREMRSGIETAPDRMNFYSTSTPRAMLGFLNGENPLIEGVVENAERGSLDAILERFRRADLDIYGIDFTPACFRDKRVFVTRAFSPQLYPLQSRLKNVFNLPVGPTSVQHELPHFFL